MTRHAVRLASQIREWTCGAARARHCEQPSGAVQGRNDLTVLAPTAAARGLSVADRYRRTPGDPDFPKLPAREKGDPLPIGREERIQSALGARQRHDPGLIEPT